MRYSNAMYREVFPEVKQATITNTIESAVDTFHPTQNDKTIDIVSDPEPIKLDDLETEVQPSEGVTDGSNSNGPDNATD